MSTPCTGRYISEEFRLALCSAFFDSVLYFAIPCFMICRAFRLSSLAEKGKTLPTKHGFNLVPRVFSLFSDVRNSRFSYAETCELLN